MGLLWKTLVRGVYKSVGLDSPYSATEYGVNWSKQRKRCLERDGYACRVCGDAEDAIGREPAVHHIRPRSQFDGTPHEMNVLGNLVTLCPECHGQFEGEFTECSVGTFVSNARERKF